MSRSRNNNRTVRAHGSQAQQQTIVEEWKTTDKYKLLIPMPPADPTRKRLEDIYYTNHWGLEDKFSALKEQNIELGLTENSVSWINGVQFLWHPQLIAPAIKNTIKYSDFSKGAFKDLYANNKEATEKKYADRIRFFARTFTPFNQYINTDDLSWVVLNETELMIEILEYHNSHYDPRKKEYVSNTIESLNKDFKSVLRVVKLIVGEESEIRFKWSSLQINLTDIEKMTDSENQLRTKNELMGFVKYEDLIQIEEALEKRWEEARRDGKPPSYIFQIHQLRLLIALYIYDFPSRHEKMDLSIIKSKSEVEPCKNYIIINPTSNTPCEFILNAEVKQHAPITYKLLSAGSKSLLRQYNLKLDRMLKESLKIYPRNSLFQKLTTSSLTQSKKPTIETVKGWLRDLLPKKNLNVNNLRSAFATYWYDSMNNSDKNLMARRMRTSKEIIQTSYIKKISDPQTQINVKADPDVVDQHTLMKAKKGSSQEVPIKVEETSDTEDVIDNTLPTNTNSTGGMNTISNNNTISIVIKTSSDPENKTKRSEQMREAMKRYYEKNKENHNKKVREYNKLASTYQSRYLKELNSGRRDTLSDKMKEKYKIKYDEDKKEWITME